MSKEKVYNNLKNNISIENFKQKNKRQKAINQVLQATLSITICFLSVTGIVFAKDISSKIYDNFFLTGEGIGTAINEGYIENSNMEYQNSNTTIENSKTGEVIEDTETQIKVNEFIMDDFTLSMTFDIQLSEKAKQIVTADEVWQVNLPDLIISDENNVVLFCLSPDRFNEFCKENNLEYNFDTATNKQYIGSGLNPIPIVREGNYIKLAYNMYTGGDSSYPKSKKLRLQMKQIKISTEEKTVMGGEEITLTGNWDFEVDVPQKMYDRKTTIYTQKSTTNEGYKVKSATLYDTGMDIAMEIKSEKQPEYPRSLESQLYREIVGEEEYGTSDILSYISWKERQTEEYKEYTKKSNYLHNISVYLTNENGEKFKMTQGPNENGSMYINENGIMEYKVMFDLTKYNKTDKITVHFDYNGDIQEVILEKKEEN